MKTSNEAILRQLLASTICSFSLVIVGTCVGWPSPVLTKFKETGEPLNLTDSEVSWMVSLMYLGNMASPIPAGFLIDWLGRRNSMLLCVIFPLSSWLLIFFTSKVYQLYIARCLAGVWSGAISTIAPLYIAEISQAKVRGALSSLLQLAANGGLLLVYVVGSFASYNTLALSMGSLPIVFLFSFIFMPESPYWLLLKDKKEAAIKSLFWLRGNDYALTDVELHYMERSINEEMVGHSFKALFTDAGNKKALTVVLFIGICLRMSGISVLIAFASSELAPEGVGALSPNECLIVIGILLVISVLIATFLIDKVGRKPLLLVSSVICGMAMFTAGLIFFIQYNMLIRIPGFKAIMFSTFVIYSLSFCIGFGPISITIQGEMFPANIKGLASGITTVTFSFFSLITNEIYYPIGHSVGIFLNFWIFSFFSFLASLFVAFYFIETKGKTLREIQEALDHTRLRISRHH